MADYYYKYFKSFLKSPSSAQGSSDVNMDEDSDQRIKDYYYQYFKSFLKKPTAKEDMQTGNEESLKPVQDHKKVIFARAPDEIKGRKRHSDSVSTTSAVKKSRPDTNIGEKKLLKKYPALEKF